MHGWDTSTREVLALGMKQTAWDIWFGEISNWHFLESFYPPYVCMQRADRQPFWPFALVGCLLRLTVYLHSKLWGCMLWCSKLQRIVTRLHAHAATFSNMAPVLMATPPENSHNLTINDFKHELQNSLKNYKISSRHFPVMKPTI